jgi:predicted RNase H-like nuclease (RuvC/YqgF family)
MPYLIVGVDPGHTIGLAALDLSGRPLRVTHIQQGGFEAALAKLESWGTPSLIASDVRPAPELVLKLASSFNAALFVPAQPWREDDKKKAVREIFARSSFSVENVHERDALSAAVQAWRHSQNLLRLPASSDLGVEDTEILRHLLLQGVRHASALEMIKRLRLPPQKEETAKEAAPMQPVRKYPPFTPSVESLSLERTVSELRKRISFLEAERESLLHRIRLLENGVMGARMADRERQKMAAQIGRLQSHIDYMQRKKMGKGGVRQARPQGFQPSSLFPVASQPKPAPAVRNQFQNISRPSLLPSPSSAPARASVLSPPAAPDADLKKLNALRLQRMIEEYRRNRASSSH